MNIQMAFLFIFIAGALTVWLFMKTVGLTEKMRLVMIRQRVELMDGHVLSISIIDRKDCPFSNEYSDPDQLYRFYKINYNNADHEMKEGWAILNLEQNWFGPFGETQTNWSWRF